MSNNSLCIIFTLISTLLLYAAAVILANICFI